MVPSYPNNHSHPLRGSICAIDSGYKRVRDAGNVGVFHENDHELTFPRLFRRLLRVSPLRLVSLQLQRCCAAGLRRTFTSQRYAAPGWGGAPSGSVYRWVR